MKLRVANILVAILSLLSTAVHAAQSVLAYSPLPAPALGRVETICSSGTTDEFVDQCVAELARYYPGMESAMDRQFTSSDSAFDSVLHGEARACTASYQLPVAEHQAFVDRNHRVLKYAQILKDAVCVGVHPDNPLNAISIAELDAVFSATRKAGWPQQISTWSELGVQDSPLARLKIHIYGGAPKWGTSQFFRQRVLQGGEFATNMTIGDVALGIEDATSVEDMILRDRSAIGFMSYRPRHVKLLSIRETTMSAAMAPMPKNIYTESYPYLVRKMYVYLDYPSPDAAPFQVRELVKFMLSLDGQAIAANLGFLPMTTAELVTAREQLGITD